MSQKIIKISIDEIYSKPPKNIHSTNKTNFYHFDNIWSLDILDLKEYGLEKNRGYWYILVVIDNFSSFGGTVALKSQNAETIKDSFEIIIRCAKRSLNSIETDWDEEFNIKIFQNSLNNNNLGQ